LPYIFINDIWLLVTAALVIVVTVKRWRWLFVAVLLAGFMLGAWRGTNEQKALDVYVPYLGQYVEVSGVLRDDISHGPKGDQRFELQEIRIDDSPVLHGKVWANTMQTTTAKRGDRLVIRGVLGEGFGNVPATMGRAEVLRVERPQPGDIPRIFRDWFAQGIRQGIPDPEAALGVGYLTGQRASLPVELDEQLRAVGLTHAVVASGYNLTILVSFARNALAGLSKYMAVFSAGLLVILFMLITGFSPSMTRAGLVSGLSLATWYYGRTIHPLVLLPIAAAITVLLRPAYAWGDIGWCLSFLAFAGIIIVSPLLRRYLWARGDEPPAILGIVIDTVAAQLTTLPIILYSFGQYAAYALPANMLVLPFVPMAMVLTFSAGVVGLAVPGLAHVAGLPASWLLKYMIWIIGQIASLPGAQTEVAFTMVHLTGSYALLSLLSVWLWRKTKVDFRNDADKQNMV
jgi:competence protein ComEC